jgi:hypothetical protein
MEGRGGTMESWRGGRLLERWSSDDKLGRGERDGVVL